MPSQLPSEPPSELAQLTVLGSCGAWPEPGRACAGLLVEHHGFRVALDLGYGTFSRLSDRLGSVSAEGLDALAITHRHPDHMVDLHALLRARWFGARGASAIPVYAADGVREVLVVLEEGDDAAIEAVFDWHPLPGTYDVGPFRLTGVDLPHYVPNVGVRLEAGSTSLAYSGDCGPSPALVDLARGVYLFVCEATDRRQQDGAPAPDVTHLHLSSLEAGGAASAAGAGRLLLTHFWPGNDRERSRLSAAEAYDGPILLAEEGLVVPLDD